MVVSPQGPGQRITIGRQRGEDGLLIPVAQMGVVYSACAVVFGGWFIYESHRMYTMSVRAEAGVEQGSEARPMRVFHASITYLTLVFLAVAVDPLLPF